MLYLARSIDIPFVNPSKPNFVMLYTLRIGPPTCPICDDMFTIEPPIFFLFFDIKTPLFLENTTFLLTYATIFLVLMSLGIALTRFKFSFRDSIIFSFLRVIIGPIIGFAVIYYFDLSGFPAGVLLIQSAMPSAILNYLVGSMYSPKKIVDSIASTIVTSTLMSFITIPIVVFFALRYFN